MNYDLELLDFSNIRRVLHQYAKTPYGQEFVQNLEPAPSIEVALQMQNAITKARVLVDSGIVFSPQEVPNCRATLKQAGNPGAMLNAQALANLVKIIRVSEYIHDFVAPYPELIPREYWNNILPLPLKQKIENAISDSGRLKPDASQKLNDLYRQIQELKAATQKKILEYISKEKLETHLDKQNQFHWYGDHLVLLVKNSSLDKVKGIIKGSHTGGSLQMVEPMILLAENNQLEKLSQEIYAEQQLILRGLSSDVAKELIILLKLIDSITWIDVVFAGAQLSAMMNASPPILVHQKHIIFDRVYHPMLLIQYLQGKIPMPVPVSLELTEKSPFILITGPNTGGKTVVLKTVGLLLIMAQCGLHIPSEGECELGWFDTVIVDMGDRQSMYHQLSTFAGHIEVMKKILNLSKSGAIFLLDELGTGTDPDEGAAIAMAMIDKLISQGSFGIVNTHLPQLKPYAKNHNQIQHAAMMFDSETLKPNYNLRMGELGQSLGLIIAEKNGLPEDVIKLASKYYENIKLQ